MKPRVSAWSRRYLRFKRDVARTGVAASADALRNSHRRSARIVNFRMSGRIQRGDRLTRTAVRAQRTWARVERGSNAWEFGTQRRENPYFRSRAYAEKFKRVTWKRPNHRTDFAGTRNLGGSTKLPRQRFVFAVPLLGLGPVGSGEVRPPRCAHLDSTTIWRLESRQNPHAGKRALREPIAKVSEGKSREPCEPVVSVLFYGCRTGRQRQERFSACCVHTDWRASPERRCGRTVWALRFNTAAPTTPVH